MGIPLNIDWQQILLHLMNFVILAGALYLLLYKPVKAFMEKRESDIKAVKDSADKQKKEAEELKTQYEEKLAEAENDIIAIKAQAAKEAEENAQMITETATKEAQAIKERAKTVIEREHRDMLENAKAEIAELATEAARKVVEGDSYAEFSDAVSKTSEQ